MRKIIAGPSATLISLFLTVIGPDVAAAEAPATVCDEVASHMNDTTRAADHVTWNDLDGYRALGACNQAIEKHPTSGRLMALLSRAYDKAGDSENAVKWARRSAETNYPLGLFLLSLHYKEGTGVAKDPEMNFRYMKAAADLGMPAAVYALGTYYRTGNGVTKDPQRALSTFNRGGELDFLNSYIAIGEMWENGEFGEVDLGKALENYEKVAARGGDVAVQIDRVKGKLGRPQADAAPRADDQPQAAAPPAPEYRFGKPTRPDPGSVWVQVASRASLDEAVALAYEYKAKFKSTRLFRSANGWYPIVVGTVKEGTIKDTIAEFVAKGMIPEDSYATKGDSFEAELPLADKPPVKAKPAAPSSPPVIAAAPTIVEDDPAPGAAAAPAAKGRNGGLHNAELLSPHTRWIVVGTFSDPAWAHAEAKALGHLPVMRTAGGRYAVVLANGTPQEMAAALDKVQRYGNLSGEAVMVDGHDFVERHFQIGK